MKQINTVRCLCAAVLAALLLSACGGNTASDAGHSSPAGSTETETAEKKTDSQETDSQETDDPAAGLEETEDKETDSTDENADEAQKADGSAAADSLIYEGNDAAITFRSVEYAGDCFFIEYDIANTGSSTVHIQLYPVLVNDRLAFSEGTFESIEPGEVCPSQIAIQTNLLSFAGIDSIGSVKGYLLFKDDNYKEITQPELITLYSKDESATGEITPSDKVVYDGNGVLMTYQGTMTYPYGGSEAVFLVMNNDTGENLNVSLNNGTDSSPPILIDGEKQRENGKYLSFDGATIPGGKEALVTVSVRDDSTYKIVPFHTADAEIYVSSNSLSPQYIPVHLSMEGGSIDVTAGEPSASGNDHDLEDDTDHAAEPSAEQVRQDETGEVAGEDIPSGKFQPVDFVEFYENAASVMFLRYKYGDETSDSEYIVIDKHSEITLDGVRGSYSQEEDEDGNLIINAQFKVQENTMEQAFLLGKMGDEYVMIPVGDYFKKNVEPDNPAWDNVVFVEY